RQSAAAGWIQPWSAISNGPGVPAWVAGHFGTGTFRGHFGTARHFGTAIFLRDRLEKRTIYEQSMAVPNHCRPESRTIHGCPETSPRIAPRNAWLSRIVPGCPG